ncbi:MAG: DUF4159 domain-containing protein [Flavobacteriaceae bacterium]|nr:DUF4159 domain-containing protein [Flavobacteriaceae bacterium]
MTFQFIQSQELAILKYDGGGDWYANPTALPNLIAFCNENIKTQLQKKPKNVEANSIEIFNYPMLFMTGHGNVFFDDNTVENLRNYLTSGGFLHVSDNYGIDKFIRREMKKIFPKLEFQEIPYNHAIFNQTYTFKNMPKIHEHDNKPAQGFGIFYKSKLVCFYDFQSDLSDGWEDEEIHHNSQEVRQKALKMGANMVQYVFMN